MRLDQCQEVPGRRLCAFVDLTVFLIVDSSAPTDLGKHRRRERRIFLADIFERIASVVGNKIAEAVFGTVLSQDLKPFNVLGLAHIEKRGYLYKDEGALVGQTLKVLVEKVVSEGDFECFCSDVLEGPAFKQLLEKALLGISTFWGLLIGEKVGRCEIPVARGALCLQPLKISVGDGALLCGKDDVAVDFIVEAAGALKLFSLQGFSRKDAFEGALEGGEIDLGAEVGITDELYERGAFFPGKEIG